MEPCCALKYFPKIEVSIQINKTLAASSTRYLKTLIQIAQNEKDGDVVSQKKEMKLADEEDFGNDFLGKWRSWLWNTMGTLKL